MSNTDSAQWLKLLQASCREVSAPLLYLIIDQAGTEFAVLDSVRSVEPPLQCYSLYNGMPENDAEELAPLLVGIDPQHPLHQHWLVGLLQVLPGQNMLLALVSLWSFKPLAEHLSVCLLASQGGCAGLLRYYDPRLFSVLLNDVLDAQQRQRWLRPVVLWSWLDLDGKPRHLRATPGAWEGEPSLNPIELTDAQMEILDCAGDAIRGLPSLSDALPESWSNQRRFQACYAAMRQASEEGVIPDLQRLAFARTCLSLQMTEQPVEQRTSTP